MAALNIPGYEPPPDGPDIDAAAEARAARQLLEHLVARQRAVEKMLLPLAARLLKVDKGLSVTDLLKFGYPDRRTLDAAGLGPRELKAAGFPVTALLELGWPRGELKAMGCCAAADFFACGSTAVVVRAAGFSLAEAKEAGCKPKLLCEAWPPADVKAAGFSAKDFRDDGVEMRLVHEAGYKSKHVSGLYTIREHLEGVRYTWSEDLGSGYLGDGVWRTICWDLSFKETKVFWPDL
jgi:hypothetical protein